MLAKVLHEQKVIERQLELDPVHRDAWHLGKDMPGEPGMSCSNDLLKLSMAAEGHRPAWD
jgi:hypothetical protein